MRAAAPAPVSTATSSPSALNFLTVSGEAATRASPARRSLRMASFMGVPRSMRAEQGQEQHDQDDEPHRPLHELREAEPGLLMGRDIHRAGSVIASRIAV